MKKTRVIYSSIFGAYHRLSENPRLLTSSSSWSKSLVGKSCKQYSSNPNAKKLTPRLSSVKSSVVGLVGVISQATPNAAPLRVVATTLKRDLGPAHRGVEQSTTVNPQVR